MSVATARRSYAPSATAVVFHEHEYGVVLSVQTVVQLAPSAGWYWITTLLIPDSPSEAVAFRVTVPVADAPGL